uniref:Uncharacterized protein n=1 Tax=Accipiter nisus TaxID=211598 RepID=A0A8B9MG01_9AVES
MESRTVDEDWGRSCLSDALPKRVPQASQPLSCFFQGKSGKDEKETRTLQLRSLQYLERYIYLILFNAYLHLEKKDSWQRPFSLWMREVAAVAGIYEVLNQLGFPELESLEGKPLCTLRGRWQAQGGTSRPFRGDFV